MLSPGVFLLAAAALGFIYLGAYYVGSLNDDARFIALAHSLWQGRYASIFEPGHPAALYPLPGYPLLIALPAALAGSHWIGLQILSVAMTVASAPVVASLLPNGSSKTLKTFALCVYLFNPYLLRFSGTVMAEPAYLLLSSLVLFLLLHRSSPAAVAAAAGACVLLRPQGGLLLAALALPVRKRSFSVLSPRQWALAAAPLALFLLRNIYLYLHGPISGWGVLSHGPQFPPDHWWLAWPYKTLILSRLLFLKTLFPLAGSARAWETLAYVPISLLGICLILAGFRELILSDPRWKIIAGYLVLSAAVSILWLDIEHRYVLACLPALCPVLVVGGKSLCARLGFRKWAPAAGALWLLLYGADHALWIQNVFLLGRPAGSPPPMESLSWIRDRLPPQHPLLSAAAPLIYLKTGHEAYHYYESIDFFQRHWRELQKKGIRYVVLLGRTSTMFRSGFPVREIHRRFLEQNGAEPVYHNASENTWIYKLPASSSGKPAGDFPTEKY